MLTRSTAPHVARGAGPGLRAAAAPGVAIAAASTLLVCMPSAPGLAGAFGLLLAAGTALLSSLALWVSIPQLMVVVVLALLPAPILGLIFPWEIALTVLIAAIVLHGWRRRESWLWRLG